MKKFSNKKVLEFLLGKKKARFMLYCQRKNKFYQAEAAFELHWPIGTAQYYCRQFVKFNLLEEIPTSYKTFYQFKPQNIELIFLSKYK